MVKGRTGGTLLGRYVWSLLTFGVSPERNRDRYLNQIALLLLDLIVSLMPQSDQFNPTDCQMFALCWMHLTHILENAFIFHYLYANTSAFNHLFEPHATLPKILPNICRPFSTSWTFTPSYSCLVPIILDCVLHKYSIWMNVPLLSEFLSWACPEFSEKWIRKSLSSSPHAAFVSLSPLFTHWFNLKPSELNVGFLSSQFIGWRHWCCWRMQEMRTCR